MYWRSAKTEKNHFTTLCILTKPHPWPRVFWGVGVFFSDECSVLNQKLNCCTSRTTTKTWYIVIMISLIRYILVTDQAILESSNGYINILQINFGSSFKNMVYLVILIAMRSKIRILPFDESFKVQKYCKFSATN